MSENEKKNPQAETAPVKSDNSQAETTPVKSDNPLKDEVSPNKTLFLGVLEKMGEFTNDDGKNVPFHNFIVSVADVPETNAYTLKVYGFEAVTLKIKAENVNAVFGFTDFNSEFIPYDWIGTEIDIRYDKKGNVKSIVRVNA